MKSRIGGEEVKAPLLIVEDDPEIRSQMKWALANDYRIFVAEDRASAIQVSQEQHPYVVTLDLGLPPFPNDVSEGLATLSELLHRDSCLKVLVVTGQGERENALKAVEQGAYDFFSKPIQTEELKIVLKRAVYLYELEMQNRSFQRNFDSNSFAGMLGTSPSMQSVFESIKRVSKSEAPVLLLGESGTGKELASRAIHLKSRRSEGPFVAINCGAIPENLLESELFGYERGAFTGAHAQKPGQIELAQKGTLFLDEVAELPAALQVKLLRFLQEGTFRRVGGQKELTVDVRLIAATNTDPLAAMREGRLREDLYYRLAVVVISMPPLRERDGDIPLLAEYFLNKYSSENRKGVSGFTPDGLQAVEAYPWPGNVRELENRIRRAAIMAEGSKLTAENLGLSSQVAKLEGKGLKEARAVLERELIERALSRNQGNVTRAAEELDVSRPTLYELMEKLGIRKDS